MAVYWRNYRRERSSSRVEQLKQDELKSALNLQIIRTLGRAITLTKRRKIIKIRKRLASL